MRRRLSALIRGFESKYDTLGVSVVRLNGARMKIEELHHALGSIGLFTKKRLVVVEECASAGSEDLQKKVLEYLNERTIPEENVVIFVESVGSIRGALFAYLKSGSHVEMFQPFGTIKLYAWVREEFARFGASFDAQAVSVLVERAGSDLWRLSGEIHKLASFRKKGAITAEDVRELVSTTYDDNMFRLTDAVCQKRPGVALKVLEQQFQLGVSPQYLLYRLHWQVRLLRDARNVEPQTEQAVRETLSVHAFVAKKTLQAVKRFSREQLDQMIARLVAVDMELKSRSTDPRALLDLCVIAMCRPTR